jgi:hypothetical protein
MPRAQPKAAPTVNTGMRGFPGIPPAPAAEPGSSDRISRAESDADFGSEEDLAAAYFNDEAAASAEAPAPPAEKSGGIFARLARRTPAPAAPPVPPAPSPDAGLADAEISEADKEAARAEAAMLQAAFGGDAASLGGTATLPGERAPRKKPSVVTIGWAVLGLIVALVVGLLMFAPSAVVSVLPGAARLYGSSAGSSGLDFEGVRYGWTSEGGQTVLEVQGDVVNNSSAAVGVPTVVIALTDERGEEISEWTTQVGEAELAAGQHAPFLRQIPSPPSNVRSVKVRFAKAD